MLEGKGMVKETDMADKKMQMQAMACASEALDLHDVIDCISIAAHIKKVLPFLLFCCKVWIFNSLQQISNEALKCLFDGF